MSDDLALDALLGIKLNVAPELSTNLLKKCYDLQKRHQFDHDRDGQHSYHILYETYSYRRNVKSNGM